MVTPPSSSLRAQKKQQVRRRIIDTTLALMRERDYADISPDEIAVRAEVGRATFFRYFESKEAAAVTGFYEQRLHDLVDVLARAPAGLGPVDLIVWAFGQLVEADYRERREQVLLLAQALVRAPALRAKAMDYQSHYERALVEAIERCCAVPRGEEWQVPLLAAAAVAVMRTVVEHWAAAGARAALPTLARRGLEQLKLGFQPVR